MQASADQNQLKWIDLGIHIACAVLLIVSFVVAQQFGFEQLKDEVDSLEVERQELKTVWDERESIAAAHQQAHDELAVQQQKLVDLLKRMPEKPREVDFLAQITGLARETKIRIQEYQPQQLTSGGEYRELKIVVNVCGGYAGLCQFMDKMHDLQRLNRVSRLAITRAQAKRAAKPEEEPEEPQYQADMELHIYFMPVKPHNRIASVTGGRYE